METISPATVIVPRRGSVPLFGATANVVAPSPLPLKPSVMVIQPSFVEAVQAQVGAEMMVIAPLPPFAAKENATGETLQVQGATVTSAAALSISPQAFVTRTQ